MQVQHGYSVARTVRGAHETNAIPVSNVFAIEDLPKVGDSSPRDEDVSMYEHLQGIRFVEVSSGQVELLIGASASAAHRAYETRLGFSNQTCALKIGLGSALFGPDDHLKPCKSESKNSVFCSLRTMRFARGAAAVIQSRICRCLVC